MGSPSEPQEETMPGVWPIRVIVFPLAAIGFMVSACTGLLGPEDSRAGLSCIDDSTECVERRQTTLNAMLADKDRTWVMEPPTPQAHASAVRLFAFRSKKSDLTCEELAHGRKEAEGAPKMLKGSQGLSPAQISRASLFAAEVNKELTAEMKKRRCRA
jgi:hypothetical protein